MVCFYLIVQMVGAGQLIQLLFGLEYNYAVVIVGILMMVYVTFGGMVATTWVQIIKAVLLLGGGTLLMLLAFSQFGFSFDRMFSTAIAVHPGRRQDHGPRLADGQPGFGRVAVARPALRHRRPAAHHDALLHRAERQKPAKSVFYATGFIGFFFLVVAVLGISAVVIVGQDPQFFEGGNHRWAARSSAAATCRSCIWPRPSAATSSSASFGRGLRHHPRGGLGPRLAGASAISHDIYARVIKKGTADARDEMRMSKIRLGRHRHRRHPDGILFKDQNIAFPRRADLRRRCLGQLPGADPVDVLEGPPTTRGALWGGIAGLVTAVGLVIPRRPWGQVLGNKGGRSSRTTTRPCSR